MYVHVEFAIDCKSVERQFSEQYNSKIKIQLGIIVIVFHFVFCSNARCKNIPRPRTYLFAVGV